MSMLRLVLVVCFAALSQSQNLLKNANCDETIVQNQPPAGWVIVSGAWTCGAPAASDFQAKSGRFFFVPGPVSVAEIYQDVTFSNATEAGVSDILRIDQGNTLFVVSTWVGSVDGDTTRFVIEMYDGSGFKIQTSNNVAVANVGGGWVSQTLAADLVALTRKIRVRLISTRVAGVSNDAFFDDLRLAMVAKSSVGGIIDSTCKLCPKKCEKTDGKDFLPNNEAERKAACGHVALGDSCCKHGTDFFGCPAMSMCCGKLCCAPNTYCNKCEDGVMKCLRSDEPVGFI
jgi:hypothetical protein